MTVLVNLGNTLGAGLLAAVFSSMVYGANVWQAYIYFSKYSFDDRNSLRIFVAGLFLIDTVCLALSTHVEYTILVTNFGDLIAELHVPWSFGASGMAATILNACIQK
ncbi:hypothetical protein BC834DRAFT_974608 [Gloeopeniophorella convolvens]|nr:hypothetical protein BC834DRAFT_974608 [Gloeopeniophorella convolvens]